MHGQSRVSGGAMLVGVRSPLIAASMAACSVLSRGGGGMRNAGMHPSTSKSGVFGTPVPPPPRSGAWRGGGGGHFCRLWCPVCHLWCVQGSLQCCLLSQ